VTAAYTGVCCGGRRDACEDLTPERGHGFSSICTTTGSIGLRSSSTGSSARSRARTDIKPALSRNSDEAGRNSTPVSPTGEIRGPGIETYSRPEPIRGFVKRRFALHTRYRVGERDPGTRAAVENRAAPFPAGSNRLHDS
jgi:hypothetical protein